MQKNLKKSFSAQEKTKISTTLGKILSVLYDVGPHPITEIQLTEHLKISRKEVQNTVEELHQLGFIIEEHPQTGYRLIETPDVLIADDLKARLAEKRSSAEDSSPIGNEILVFKKTTSTNDIVQRLAKEGYPEGVVVFAESQSAGRGRQGRKWISPANKGLWFTILLRPKVSMQMVSQLTILSGVAVVAALKKSTGLPLFIKWPNDIQCRDHKIGGILVEAGLGKQGMPYAAVGIGLNVNMEKADFPEEFRDAVSSLKLEAHKFLHPPTLAVDMLFEFARCYTLLLEGDFADLLEEWVELDQTLGKQISLVHQDGHRIHGLAANIDPDGALLLRTDDGRIERIVAGEVSLEKVG